MDGLHIILHYLPLINYKQRLVPLHVCKPHSSLLGILHLRQHTFIYWLAAYLYSLTDTLNCHYGWDGILWVSRILFFIVLYVCTVTSIHIAIQERFTNLCYNPVGSFKDTNLAVQNISSCLMTQAILIIPTSRPNNYWYHGIAGY